LIRSDRYWFRSIGATAVAAMLSAVLMLMVTPPANASRAHLGAKADDKCPGGNLNSGNGGDIVIDTPCTVKTGTYHWGDVNIIQGGSLTFTDSVIDFWAKSIIIQNGGAMLAGVVNAGESNEQIVPIGTAGGLITFHLYGKDQGVHGKAAVCRKKKDDGSFGYDQYCGIDPTFWNNANKLASPPPTCTVTNNLPGHVDDCFYQYGTLPYDDGDKDMPGYFGYKSIGLGYGGTLRLYGLKGADYSDTDPQNDKTVDPSNTGQSWVRLNNCPNKMTGTNGGSICKDGDLQKNSTVLIASKPVTTWKPKDWIILTSTDYLPGHSEQLQIKSVSDDGLTITLMDATPLKYPHNASQYDLSSLSGKKLTDLTSVDTRAAVGLLTRSIRIVSEGPDFMTFLPAATDKSADRYFGGHVIFRQGFQELQLQGVEFYQLGQGGRIGHYPIHFHLDRKVPATTFVKDCSIWDSMTRWIVVHATQGVLLARNVGYRSIGHGYYLEDGTETNNRLYANLGVSAIAAVDDTANYRKVPGILAFPKTTIHYDNPPTDIGIAQVPYKTDFDNPAIFWSMNGWNDWEYNMAVGAETCGLCYWMVPGNVSGPSRKMSWVGYASEQFPIDKDGNTPIQKFLGNSCSSATEAFTDIADVVTCNGTQTGTARLAPVTNDLAPVPQVAVKDPKDRDITKESYYPIVHGGTRHATLCTSDTADCSGQKTCGNGADEITGCAVTTLDRFTSSFTYAEQNFAALWLRPQWNLLINSAITDALNGGVTFVTGGGYTRSDAVRGLFELARKDVFIGNTQDEAGSPFASNGGPVNPDSGLTCKNNKQDYNYCLALNPDGSDLGFLAQRSNLAVNQRMFSIYDGPAFEDSNAFLDITPTVLDDCDLTSSADKRCQDSKWMEGVIPGVPGYFVGEDKPPNGCYLPNAAIAWKQSNGFYYPPAFHSRNLYFHNVDIRHYVIEPLFKSGTYKTDPSQTRPRYCNTEPTMFDNFTDIDRQTELNDDDGSLTGLVNTISVNQDPFFNAPTQDTECRSDVMQNVAGTAKTSPYDYVTAVIYPDSCTAAQKVPADPTCGDPGWYKDCGNPRCYGVPLYRQLLTPGESTAPAIRMAGQGFGQRSTMIPNNGVYYIDTTVSAKTQSVTANLLNVFGSGKKYHLLLLFAKPSSTETFQIFVGKNLPNNGSDYLNTLTAETANLNGTAFTFTPLQGGWPAEWGRSYDSTHGTITVTMNMNFSTFTTDYTNSIPGRCQPQSMCTPGANNTCVCNITDKKNYLYNDCQADSSAICSWAIKDIDYPDGGAYGFSFTMPTDPTVNNTGARPGPDCFPQYTNAQMTPSPWNVPFAVASPDVAGDCYYANSPPSPTFCPTATPTP
jgi:hypothetical protein